MRHRRAVVLIFAAFALLASMFAMPDANANQPATLSAGTVTVETGASTTLPVTWDPGSVPAHALTIEITYEPSIATVDSCTPSPLIGLGDCGFGTPGVIRIVALDFRTAIAAGSLAEIGVTGASAGETPLTIRIETIADGIGTSLPESSAIITNGSVTVEEPEPEPEPERDRRRRWRRLIRRLWMRWLRGHYLGHWNGW